MPQPDAPRIVLVGASGYGARHLDALAPLVAAGDVELVALVDPADLTPQAAATGARHLRSLDELLTSDVEADVAIIATPIHTHAPLAAQAVRAGLDVLLEKPPTSSLGTFTDLVRTVEDSGRLVQVGFQSLGSHAVAGLQELLASGRIGTLRAVSATGLWLRRESYYARSPWAGLRRLGDVDVVDGVVTNPLAHAVVTALTLAGAREADDLAALEVELYRANPISSDDTSVVRAVTADGVPVTCALTLCAPQEQDPWVVLEGTEGRATFFYKSDEVLVETPEGTQTLTFGRDSLLEDLLAVRRGDRDALMVPLRATGAFMRVLEAVRTAPEPTEIDPAWVRRVGPEGDTHAVVADVAEIFARVTRSQTGLASLDVPWATRPDGRERTGEALAVGDRVVARVRLGDDLAPTTSPRPVLHPVRTLDGTLVSAHQPLDHVWHLGLGVAVQDVAGVNVWGGRTFTSADRRYVWLRDHGRAERTGARLTQEADGGRLEESLVWSGPDGGPVLREERAWAWSAADAGQGRPAWSLALDVQLAAPGEDDVPLGSPGSNGREGGGYGGIFWRLPEVADLQVRTADAEGEEAVHGSVSPWLLVTGGFPTGQDALVEHADARTTAPASLLLVAADDDPWFVRVSGYPGVGRSLAWDRPAVASPGRPVRRGLRALVVDGTLTVDEAARLAGELAAGAR